MNDFDDKLNEIHDRVLNKALTKKSKIVIQNLCLSLLNTSINMVKSFGMPEKCKMHLNIANGAGLRK